MYTEQRKRLHLNDANWETQNHPSPLRSASYVDPFVEPKEIQSENVSWDFIPLWEIKRFNSPCLSTLIIITFPSAAFVCLVDRLLAPMSRNLKTQPHLLSLVLFQAVLLTCSLSSRFKRKQERRVRQIIISWRRQCYGDRKKQVDWSTLMQSDNESTERKYIKPQTEHSPTYKPSHSCNIKITSTQIYIFGLDSLASLNYSRHTQLEPHTGPRMAAGSWATVLLCPLLSCLCSFTHTVQ